MIKDIPITDRILLGEVMEKRKQQDILTDDEQLQVMEAILDADEFDDSLQSDRDDLYDD